MVVIEYLNINLQLSMNTIGYRNFFLFWGCIYGDFCKVQANLR